MTRVRVLVVEDSATVRAHLKEVLGSDAEIEVVGEAEDGKHAIELCRRLRPDIVTLDMMIPMMSGLAVTEYIMAHFPIPILIVSASTNRGELFRTYDALAAGAVDVLEKPTGQEPDGQWERRFLATVKLVSRIKVITHPRLRIGALGRAASLAPSELPIATPGKYSVVAIGASTGGPAAVVEVLRALPAPYRIPVILVLHIGEPFAAAFADWLDGQTPHRVSYARDGEPFAAVQGRVVMAPADCHLVIQNNMLRLTGAPERHSCRPSVDVLFESVAQAIGASAAACLLTGMGRDGAAGLLEIRRAGGLTIAQDEATSVVYGMPREALLLGAAQRILPLDEVGPALASLAGSSPGRRLA
jgi:two-component system, chemotaxis family, protein-glutamate methylesterase/glutaminase